MSFLFYCIFVVLLLSSVCVCVVEDVRLGERAGGIRGVT